MRAAGYQDANFETMRTSFVFKHNVNKAEEGLMKISEWDIQVLTSTDRLWV